MLPLPLNLKALSELLSKNKTIIVASQTETQKYSAKLPSELSEAVVHSMEYLLTKNFIEDLSKKSEITIGVPFIQEIRPEEKENVGPVLCLISRVNK